MSAISKKKDNPKQPQMLGQSPDEILARKRAIESRVEGSSSSDTIVTRQPSDSFLKPCSSDWNRWGLSHTISTPKPSSSPTNTDGKDASRNTVLRYCRDAIMQ